MTTNMDFNFAPIAASRVNSEFDNFILKKFNEIRYIRYHRYEAELLDIWENIPYSERIQQYHNGFSCFIEMIDKFKLDFDNLFKDIDCDIMFSINDRWDSLSINAKVKYNNSYLNFASEIISGL